MTIIPDTTKRDRELALEILRWFVKPIPNITPAEWVEANVIFNEPEIKGRFSFTGREYLRDIINDVTNDEVHDQTLCFGTGAGKTIATMARTYYMMEFDPARGLWVMPATQGPGGARIFSQTRFIPGLKETFPNRTPPAATLHIEMAGNVIDFVGSNSPGQIGSNRCRWVQQDEKDKFKRELSREAGAGYLANERTKGVVGAKRYGTSTPTVEDGPIWQDLIASDLRRRFLPCLKCAKSFVLVMSEQYTVLPVKFADGTPIPLAQMKWDKEAKRKDGSWDMARLIRSTRFECPHCGFHVRDQHRDKMDRNGVWKPTQHGSPYHVGYHLPSFYAPYRDFDSSFGGMAKKFMDAHQSSDGMRGYINSELAEVDASQEHAQQGIEVRSTNFAQTDWTAMMSCDFQKLWPYIWFVVQKWSSFKLQPSPVSNLAVLSEGLRRKCETLAAPSVVGQLLRFDSRTGDFPVLDWLIAHKLTGKRLDRLYVETCQSNTLDLGRWVFREMGVTMPKGGDSEVIVAGHCELTGDDAWAELREIQQQFKVGEMFLKWGMNPNRAVIIDAGYAEDHNPEVLRKCFESGVDGRMEYYDPAGKKFATHRTSVACRPTPIDGWVPFKGYPIHRRWKVNGIDAAAHWAADDPFKGLSEADRYGIGVLEAASDYYFHKWMDSRERQKKILEAIKENQTYIGNIWSVANDIELYPKKRFTIEMFNAQLNSKGRDSDGDIWEKGSGGGGKRRHPDHLNDCCRNMFALAEVHGFFSYDTKEGK